MAETNNHNNHLAPSDSGWRDDKALIAELSTLNTKVTRYILRQLDADARRTAPPSVTEERALGRCLAVIATKLAARADRREVLDTRAQLPALEPSPETDTTNDP